MKPDLFKTLKAYQLGLRREPWLVAKAAGAQTICALAQGAAVLVIVRLFGRAFGRPAAFTGPVGHALSSAEASIGSLSLVLTFVGLGVVAALFRKFGADACCRLRLATEGKLREEMMEAIQRISWSGFTDLRLGTLSKAILADCARYADGTEKLALGLASLSFVGIFLVLALLTAPATVALVGTALLAGLIGFRLAHGRIGKQARINTRAARQIANGAFEMINHWKFVKSSGMAGRLAYQSKSQHEHYSRQSLAVSTASHTVHALLESWAFVLIGLSLSYGLLRKSSHAVEELTVFGMFVRMLPQILSAQRYYDGAKLHQHAAIAWQDLLDEIKAKAEPPRGGNSIRFEHELAFHDVSVSFRPEQPGVLRSLSFKLPKFGCLVITGRSGAGKTTILDLVSGLLNPSSGSVLIDGQPLSELDLSSWQAMIGIVSQNVPLFFGTVAENFSLGDENPDADRIWQAAELACAMDFIKVLPGGFDGNIGEGGIKLSGGQRQRIAIARALYKEPQLLLLDEVTSSLDPLNEAAVTDAIRQLKGKVTMIIVTHRLHTVDMADQVLNLEAGEWVPPVTRPGEATL